MSETLEPEKPEKIPSIPLAPLPRLWKTEPEDSEDPEETDQDRPLKKIAKNDADVTAPKKASKAKLTFTKPKTDAKPAKPKSKSKSTVEGDAKDKKVLVEETPAFDTYEARQRARIILGSLLAVCILLGCWIFYRVLFHDPTDPSLYAEEPITTQALPEARPSSLDGEALYMFNRAKEYAKQNRTDQAIGMLKRVVASYKGTTAAAEARVALERPKQGLPLFPEGPAVVAVRDPIAAPPGTTPTPAVSPASPPASPGPAQGPLALAPTQPPAQPSPSSPAPKGPVSMVPTQPPTQTTQQARGPVSMVPIQPQGQSPQPAPAPVAPPRGPVSMVPTQPQGRPNQPDPIPSNPNQPPPPPGSGQVAMIVPAPAGGPPVTPNPADTVDRKPDGIAVQGLTQRLLPPGFKAKAEAGLHESGWPRMIVGERDGAPMVLVPGGTFTMGNDSGDPIEAPTHTVRLSTYYIDQYEVTIGRFRDFLDETHYRGQPPGKWLTDEKQRDKAPGEPAVFVSYRDAETFAIWAGKRLPTEAQWEMAARSTDGRRYPWGDHQVKWARPRESRQIDPVGTYPEDVSSYGVFDMAGNAMEWTRDWFDPRYFAKLQAKVAENPTGPTSARLNSIQRVVKGTSKSWNASARMGLDLDKRLPYLGFRCSLAVEGPEASAGISPHPVKPPAQPANAPAGADPPGGDVPF